MRTQNQDGPGKWPRSRRATTHNSTCRPIPSSQLTSGRRTPRARAIVNCPSVPKLVSDRQCAEEVIAAITAPFQATRERFSVTRGRVVAPPRSRNLNQQGPPSLTHNKCFIVGEPCCKRAFRVDSSTGCSALPHLLARYIQGCPIPSPHPAFRTWPTRTRPL